jgi:hypothetical protein
MYQWRSILLSTAVAAGVWFGTAVTIAIAVAIVGLYLSGHNIEVPTSSSTRAPSSSAAPTSFYSLARRPAPSSPSA